MASSVLLFCIGAAASALLVAVLWGLRGLFGLLRPWAYYLLLSLGVVASATALAMLATFVIQGYYSQVGTAEYKRYLFLTSNYASELALGACVGPVLFFWVRHFSLDTPSDEQRRSQRVLTVTLSGLLIFSLLLPYLNGWLTNATSVEFAQLAKISIDARQNSGNQAPSFVSGAAETSSNVDFKGNDVLNGLLLLMGMTSTHDDNGVEKPGMMDRDEQYIQLTKREGDSTIQELESHIANDRKFLAMLYPVAACLRQYANEYHDYRLFLIDIKPIIVMVTTFARSPALVVGAKPDEAPLKALNELKVGLATELKKLPEDVVKRLSSKKGIDLVKECTQSIDFKILASDYNTSLGNFLPYKTIALSYLLSAIGSGDTAVVELNDWILHYADPGVPKWYVLRAKMELNFLLEKVLPGGYRNPIYRRFVEDLARKYQEILPTPNLLTWSSRCEGHRAELKDKKEKLRYEEELVFTYMTQRNMWVKASSNSEEINSEITDYADINRKVDITCFRERFEALGDDSEAWRAEFMTSYAIAILVYSYDERLYGRTEHADQQRLRDVARQHLFDAANILAPIVQRGRNDPDSRDDARAIFARPRWEDTEKIAKGTLRNMLTRSK